MQFHRQVHWLIRPGLDLDVSRKPEIYRRQEHRRMYRVIHQRYQAIIVAYQNMVIQQWIQLHNLPVHHNMRLVNVRQKPKMSKFIHTHTHMR